MARVAAGRTLARPRRRLRVTTLVRIPPSRVRVRAVLAENCRIRHLGTATCRWQREFYRRTALRRATRKADGRRPSRTATDARQHKAGGRGGWNTAGGRGVAVFVRGPDCTSNALSIFCCCNLCSLFGGVAEVPPARCECTSEIAH